MDAIESAIAMTGAQGVHPGYGFLSENCDFADRVNEMRVVDVDDVDGARGDEAGGIRQRTNVKFIGPSTHAIRSLGDKIQSKLLAIEAGVSTIPGYNGVVTTAEHAIEIANSIGYPVMIKASAGGGGKGMRICHTDDDVRDGYRLSRSEAKSYFGDDRLLVERYIVNPHHIEIQVLSGINPTTGKLDILCFPERECSIQRRNQKVIEESPSPHLLPSTRQRMIKQVKSLVRTVGYESAGTVEFLVDEDQNFYFLEMNTRLQVEHPVTEMISGYGHHTGHTIDLVYGMLEVAAGRGIPQEYLDMVDTSSGGGGGSSSSSNDDGDIIAGAGEDGSNVKFVGHAIEARIYAEDPYRGFLPSTGPLVKYVEPPSLICVKDSSSHDEYESVGAVMGTIVGAAVGAVTGGPLFTEFGKKLGEEFAGAVDDVRVVAMTENCFIRIDSGVVPGSIVTPHYDPILSKIIAYSPTSRDAAIRGLGMALDRYLIRGDTVRHNIPFVRDVLRNPYFVKGCTPTSFIETHYPDGFVGGLGCLSDVERCELVVIAREIVQRRAVTLGSATVVGVGGMDDVVVCLGGMFGDAYLVRTLKSSSTTSEHNVAAVHVTRLLKHGEKNEAAAANQSQSVTMTAFEYHPSSDFAHCKIAGESRVLQVHGEDEIGTLKLTMYGADADVLVMSPAEYQLTCHMMEPVPLDLGDFVLSPMPGTLVSFAVKEGDIVEMGQELCVVEAMKMQNIIRSHKAGAIVEKLHGTVGASLRADEILLEFVKLEP